MKPLVVWLVLPLLYWPHGLESATALRASEISSFAVPEARAAAWRTAGFNVTPISNVDLNAREKLPAPRIAGRAELASPTRTPWVTANGWRFLRRPAGRYYYESLPASAAALAAAEAFAYNIDALLAIDPADLPEFARMLAFFNQLPPADLPPVADIGVVDDGSELAGEVMNLLARRNLLFSVVAAPSSLLPVNIRLGTKEYPLAEAANPSEFALKIRRQLGDERRSLRLYGSEAVIGRLTGDGARARLHLLNYSQREIDHLRVRVRGSYAQSEGFSAHGRFQLADYLVADGATEFSIPRLGAYAVIDLRAK